MAHSLIVCCVTTGIVHSLCTPSVNLMNVFKFPVSSAWRYTTECLHLLPPLGLCVPSLEFSSNRPGLLNGRKFLNAKLSLWLVALLSMPESLTGSASVPPLTPVVSCWDWLG